MTLVGLVKPISPERDSRARNRLRQALPLVENGRASGYGFAYAETSALPFPFPYRWAIDSCIKNDNKREAQNNNVIPA
jgi:hypothetical protein